MASDADDPCPATPLGAGAGVALAVRLTPRASSARIDGIERGVDGRAWLRVSVTAPPEGGKANAALIALLAKRWRIPKSAFTIGAGAASRNKTLRIAADADAVMRALAAIRERAR